LLLDIRPRPTGPWEAAWALHPSVLIGTALLGALYLWGIGPARRRWHLGPPAEGWRIFCFMGGLLVILLSLNGPIHDLSDYYLFWVHMAQHLLLTLVLPPLLLAGTPPWLLEPLLRRPPARAAARLLTHPVVAGVIFTASLAAWHTIAAYDLMMREHGVHVTTHLMFMVTAVLFWWPVMGPAPSVPRLTPGMAMQILGAIITFADEPLYTWYVDAPRTWGLSPLDDQKIGGLLMWVAGNLWIWGAMSVLFFRWARQERREP
jgi:putative membrane protein